MCVDRVADIKSGLRSTLFTPNIALDDFGKLFQQVNRKIFVRGLPWETTDHSLRSVFEQYGEIVEVRVISCHRDFTQHRRPVVVLARGVCLHSEQFATISSQSHDPAICNWNAICRRPSSWTNRRRSRRDTASSLSRAWTALMQHWRTPRR